MNFGLENKKVLVTGGSRGIGRSIALDFAKEGAKVAIVARNKTDLNNTLNELESISNGHRAICCDLSEEGRPQKVSEELANTFGEIDIIINNLGDTLGITDPYCSLDDWRKIFRINFEVSVELNNYHIPLMKKRGEGTIIHVASNASLENSGPVTYCVTKAALAAYAQTLGRELAASGITVASVLPGAIISKGSYWDRASYERPKHVGKYIVERLPLNRFGKADEISPIVLFLCSNQATYSQGDLLTVDGGQSTHFFWPAMNIE